MFTKLGKQIFKNNKLNSYKIYFSKKKLSEVVYNRQKYMSPSLRTFEAYQTPLVLERGNMQHVYDDKGNKYIDLFEIPKKNTILICGYFGYNFYTNPSDVSSLCDELYSHIPIIFDDKNNTNLTRYVLIRKITNRKRIELHYENNVCKYII